MHLPHQHMDVEEGPLGSRNRVPGGCGRCVFTSCRDVPPGWLEALQVDGSPAAEVPLELLDADGEVRFPIIYINEGGSLSAVLQNRWEDGRGGGGHYSLLQHAQQLQIRDNPQAVEDLAAYVEGTYQLGRHWQRQELRRDMVIEIDWTGAESRLVQALGDYFTRVVLNGEQVDGRLPGPRQRVSVVEEPLRSISAVPEGCERCVFTGCRDVSPGEFGILYIGGSPTAEVPVEFRDADDEVRFPEICIMKGGSLRAVLQDRWSDGSGGGGRYSILHHARILRVWGNSQAVRDLVDYVQGTYQLGKHWQRQGLNRDMVIEIYSTETGQQLVRALRAHFTTVMLNRVQVGDTVQSSIREWVNSVWGYKQNVFTDCRGVPSRELRELSVDGSPAGDVPVVFQDADGEMHFQEIYVNRGGSLRAVLHNRWEDGTGGGGDYSLLHHAQRLEIRDSPHAVEDLVAYVQGTYSLGERWQPQQLSRDTEVTIRQTETELQLVQTLRAHFATVGLDEVWVGSMMWASVREQENAVKGSRQHVFTGCRGVPPEKLGTLVVRGGPVAEVPVEFWDADGEVRFPRVYVDKSGSLRAVLWNRWDDGNGDGGCYSLLWHAEALTIRGNAQAVRDLAAYVTGRYDTGGPRWPVRPLDRGLRLAVEGVAGCEAAVGALAEYFGAVTVDGQEVLSEIRQMLADCNEREEALRAQRGGTADKRLALGEAAVALAEKLQEAQRARLRLRNKEGQLATFAACAQ